MPRNVRLFEWLMYGTLLLSTVVAPFNDRFHASLAKFGPGILVAAAVVLALVILVIWGIARRRKNWLRWTWLVLFVVGLPNSVLTGWPELRSHPVNGGLFFVTLLMQVVPFYLIFTGDAVPWFRKGANLAPMG